MLFSMMGPFKLNSDLTPAFLNKTCCSIKLIREKEEEGGLEGEKQLEEMCEKPVSTYGCCNS